MSKRKHKQKRKKKKNSHSQLSPKQYVKTKARQLPIHECLINEDWQEAGIAEIIVARRHKNGNITCALYLVDLLCLGVKDTFFAFNLVTAEYENIKNEHQSQLPIAVCDYALAHNIIYGGIRFAEKYGFQPHKDFVLTKYLLEDEETVETLNIEFGEDGYPCLVTTFDDEPKHIIRQLERTAGPGNFKIVYLDEDDEDYYDDEDYEDEDYAFDDEWEDEPEWLHWTEEDFEKLKRGEKKLSDRDMARMVDEMYDVILGEENATTDNLPKTTELKRYTITFDPIDDGRTSEAEKEKMAELNQLVRSDEAGQAIKPLKELIKQYPDNPIYYNYLASAYENAGKHRKARKVVEHSYNRFPDYLFAKCNYAQYLFQKKKIKKIPELFDHKFDLQSLYPEKNEFHITEVISFHAVMCRYFAALDDLKTATVYANVLEEFDEIDNPMKKVALSELRFKKLNKILEKDRQASPGGSEPPGVSGSPIS